MSRFLALFLAVSLGACQPSGRTSEAPEASRTSEVPDPSRTSEGAVPYQVYGESLTPAGALSVESVAAAPSTYVGEVVKVEGTVRQVCQMKGCWLTLEAEAGPDVRIRVPKTGTGEYLYTVPTDLSGRRVVVEGKLEESTLSEAERRHYAEESGGDLDGDVQPLLELSMTATSVLVQTGAS